MTTITLARDEVTHQAPGGLILTHHRGKIVGRDPQGALVAFVDSKVVKVVIK